ncbi:MAG: hypothetical protein K0U74_01145 [Alphaproteobacteria bacterium]|nr:hypothetical protein [Alphaproteobacteria bacterium]
MKRTIFALAAAGIMGLGMMSGAAHAQKAKTPCTGLDQAACTANTADRCKWLPEKTKADGKVRKALCWQTKANPCTGKAQDACDKAKCDWVTDAVNKKGKARPAFCRVKAAN